MTGVKLDLRIDSDDWTCLHDVSKLCLRALSAAARIAGRSGDVSLLLTDDAAMQKLNGQWRDQDRPTDVLSFPAGSQADAFLGDIAIGYGLAARDAGAQDKALTDHLAHLLVHGYLHLCGYDHMEDTEAAKMEALEISALASLGIPDPYSIKPKTRS